MDINVDKINLNLGNAGKAGAAVLVPAATVIVAIFEPGARVATSAVAGALALLIVWTLCRGGTVALPGLTLSGRQASAASAAPPAIAPATPPALQAASPPARTPRNGTGAILGLAVVLVAAAAVVLFLANASHAAAGSSPAPARVPESGSAVIAREYYAAVNQRDWPKAWQLAGGKSRDYGTAAYQQWIDGYSCTVQDRITRIAAKGDKLLVFVRALETGGITQDYELRYVVRHGVLTKPRMLRYTGHAPQGCSR